MRSEKEREALAAEFDRHVCEEDAILKEYHQLSDALPDGPLSVLINQIVTEEEMHHFLLRTLSDWLRTPPSGVGEIPPGGLDRDAILRQTRALQEHEKTTVEACRSLKSRFDSQGDDLFECLLESIALDSEKHHRLLATVARLIGRQEPAR